MPMPTGSARSPENLHHSGLEVFFDEWDIGPGDVLVHRIDDGLLNQPQRHPRRLAGVADAPLCADGIRGADDARHRSAGSA